MPLFRYFAVVGSLLVAMLFIADSYLGAPAESVIRNAGEVDKSVIRIHSTHKWPDPIVFDTSLPTIVPPPSPVFAAAPVERPPRDAFAQLTKPLPKVLENPLPVKTKRKVARHFQPTRMAAYRPAPRTAGFAFDWNW